MPDPVLLVLDAAPPPRLGRLTGRADVRYADSGSLAGLLPAADALLVWDVASDAVRAAWPGPGRRPRWVHTAGADVDRILCPELVASDTVLTTARGVFERPVAEHVAGWCSPSPRTSPGPWSSSGSGAAVPARDAGWPGRGRWWSARGRSAGRSPGCCTGWG